MSKLESLFKIIEKEYPGSMFVYNKGKRQSHIVPCVQIFLNPEKNSLIEVSLGSDDHTHAICSLYANVEDNLNRKHYVYSNLYWKGNYTHKSNAFHRLRFYPESELEKVNNVFKRVNQFMMANSLRFILEGN